MSNRKSFKGIFMMSVVSAVAVAVPSFGSSSNCMNIQASTIAADQICFQQSANQDTGEITKKVSLLFQGQVIQVSEVSDLANPHDCKEIARECRRSIRSFQDCMRIRQCPLPR